MAFGRSLPAVILSVALAAAGTALLGAAPGCDETDPDAYPDFDATPPRFRTEGGSDGSVDGSLDGSSDAGPDGDGDAAETSEGGARDASDANTTADAHEGGASDPDASDPDGAQDASND